MPEPDPPRERPAVFDYSHYWALPPRKVPPPRLTTLLLLAAILAAAALAIAWPHVGRS
jgi:hypothetical protein